MKTVYAVIAVLMGGAPVFAQTDNLGAAVRGATCSVVDDAEQRLQCFDRAFPHHRETAGADEASISEVAAPDGPEPLRELEATIPGDETVAVAKVWSIELSTSEYNQSPVAVAKLLPTLVSGDDLDASAMELALRCENDTTSVALSIGRPVAEEATPVTVKVGEMAAASSDWELSDDQQSIGLWRGATAIPFIRSLKNNARLSIAIGEPVGVSAEFDLGAVSEIAQQIAEVCHWSVRTMRAVGGAAPIDLGID